MFTASVFKHRVFIHPVFKHRVFKHVSQEVAVSRTTHIVPSYRILSCQVASFLCRCLRLCVDVLFRAVVASSPTRLSHSHGYGRYRGRGCFAGVFVYYVSIATRSHVAGFCCMCLLVGCSLTVRCSCVF